MVDITEISAMVAAAGVLVGVVYYILDMRHQRRVRDTDLIMKLYATFSRKEFQQPLKQHLIDYQSGASYSELREKSGVLAPEDGLFFEGIGLLLHRKLIDISLVDDLFSGWIIRYWEAAKKYAEEARKTMNYPQFAEWVEYLYNEMKKREQKLQ